MDMQANIALQREPFDAGAEVAALTRGRTDIGAVVTFTGLCRGEENGAPIAALTLEHYPEMAQAFFWMSQLAILFLSLKKPTVCDLHHSRSETCCWGSPSALPEGRCAQVGGRCRRC